MEENNAIITCPQCGVTINVSEILYHQVRDQLKNDFEQKNAEKENTYQVMLKALNEGKEQLAQDKKMAQELVDQAVKSKLSIEKVKLEKSISDNLREETNSQFQTLIKELQEKSSQVKELNQIKVDIERLKREKDELQESLTLEKEKEFTEKLRIEKLKIQTVADENMKELNQTKLVMEQLKREKDQLRETISLEKEIELTEKLKVEKLKIESKVEGQSLLKIEELKKQLEDQKKLAEEMKRKAEQGSMQLQGEIQELVLEEALRSLFPFDVITEVPKGVKGADAIHKVRNNIGVVCGTILYESKRTKAFSNEWIGKLKADAVATKSDVCIIVTESLPDDMEKIGQRDGVWICSFNDFKGLVLVLRDGLLRINEAYASQTNKGERMQMLYDYLNSNEFKLQLGAIVEGFAGLQDSYVQEKRSMERIWKQREKQLERVLLNTNHFIGSIKGIAGNSISGLKEIGASDNLLEMTI